jgi:protein phosphatase
MSVVESVLKGNHKPKAEEVINLNEMVRDYYNRSPNVISTPKEDVIYVGDLHGDLDSLLKVKEIFLRSTSNLVFLGDYADRGPAQIETVNLVFALLLSYPKRVTVLRGNHETENIASKYGFKDVVTTAYSNDIFESYCDAFSVLPLVAASSGTTFACHGGVPRGVTSIDQIKRIDRFKRNLDEPIPFQLIWNDPSDGDFTFNPNIRGGRSLVFGERAFNEFMEDLNFQLMIRAHQVYPEGIKLYFNGRLVSVFSASYMGRVKPKIVHLGNSLKVHHISL